MKKAYSQHKSNAKRRGVDFALTYSEWMDIWEQSGHLADRGRGAGKYCMCRIGDAGAYAVGNVFIGLNAKNVSDGNLGKPDRDETRAKKSAALKGQAKEWARGDGNPMRRPEVKAKVAAAISGSKHYNHKGVVTPQGYFETAKAAAAALGIPKPTVEWRCRHNKFGFSYNLAFA